MIGTLTTYFPNLKSVCWIDDNDKTVYLESERVSVSNTAISGYVRLDGVETFEEIDSHTGVYESTQALSFIGAVPNGVLTEVRKAALSSLLDCNIEIKEIITDKVVIGESEGINLSGFTNVVLIKVDYDYTFVTTINKCDDINMCKC